MTEDAQSSDVRSAEADLALIRAMMSAGRKRAGINGSHLVLWGGLLTISFLVQYAITKGWLPNMDALPWIIMMVVGWSGSMYLGKKNGPSCMARNPALVAYSAAWGGVGVTMLLHLVAAIIAGGVPPGASTILSAGVIGSAFFVMAHVLELRPLFLAAAGWWAIMVYAIVTPHLPREILLILSAAAAFLVLVPGLYLQQLAKNEG
jgi:hypothetical protein